MYTIYKHTCIANGKVYIGQTSRDVEKRWGNNGINYKRNKHFWPAIEKYGWDYGFFHEVVCTGLTKAEADKKEQELIALYHSNQRDRGYNMTSGGDGVCDYAHTAETKDRISQSLSGENHHRFGKHLDAITKKKISDSLIGKMSGSKNPFYGKHHSETTIQKISKPVYCVELEKVFAGARSAANELGISQGNITKACQGRLKTSGGYHWKYLNDVAKS